MAAIEQSLRCSYRMRHSYTPEELPSVLSEKTLQTEVQHLALGPSHLQRFCAARLQQDGPEEGRDYQQRGIVPSVGRDCLDQCRNSGYQHDYKQ